MIWVALGMAAVTMAASAKAGADAQNAQGAAATSATLQGARDQARVNIENKWTRDATRSEAQQIRAQSIQVRGSQMASMAKAGIVIGDGSTQSMLDETIRLTEQDAVAALQRGAKATTAGDIKYRDIGDKSAASAESIALLGKAQNTGALASGIGNAAGILQAGGVGVTSTGE